MEPRALPRSGVDGAVTAARGTDWDRWGRSSVFDGFQFHWLRHAAGSLMAVAGMDPAVASERMGHRDGEALFLRTYRHLRREATLLDHVTPLRRQPTTVTMVLLKGSVCSGTVCFRYAQADQNCEESCDYAWGKGPLKASHVRK
jgi:hypothetical protein